MSRNISDVNKCTWCKFNARTFFFGVSLSGVPSRERLPLGDICLAGLSGPRDFRLNWDSSEASLKGDAPLKTEKIDNKNAFQ